MGQRRWRGTYRASGETWESGLEAVWEAELDPISDDYTPDEVSAEELLSRWSEEVGRKHADGMVPIEWYVRGPEALIFQFLPFAWSRFPSTAAKKNFLEFYTCPEDAVTGERLNWMTLPVADKLWRPGRADKGGFIQEATGWKPSIAQPFLYLPALLKGWGG